MSTEKTAGVPTGTPDRTALIGLLLVAFSVRAVTLLFPSIHWPDEIYQVLEHAHRWVFGYGITSWDWQYGIRSAVPPALFTPFLWLARELGLGPGFYLPLVGAALCAWSVVVVWAAFRMAGGGNRGVVAAAPAALWGEMVLFAPHPLMDTLAAPLLVLGLLGLTREGGRARLWTGVCFGAVFCLRPALAPAMLAATVLCVGRDARGWALLAAGGLLAIVPYGLADLAVGRPPLAAVLQYASLGVGFVGDTLAGGAGSNPAQPRHLLFTMLLLHWGSVLPVLVLLIAAGARGNLVWVVTALAIFLTYSLLPQREYRYVYPALTCLMIPMGVGLARIVETLAQLRVMEGGAVARLAVMVFALCSLLAARGPGMADEWRHGSVGLEALAEVRETPKLCGLGLAPEVSVSFLGGYTVLHRNVPIYDGVEDLAGRSAYYDSILTARPRGDLPPSYALVSCRDGGYADWGGSTASICHYHRPGGCAAPDADGPAPMIRPDPVSGQDQTGP
ncbi:MAG: hypothetical protein AB7O49_03065 [Sphingomonadales bacterium]